MVSRLLSYFVVMLVFLLCNCRAPHKDNKELLFWCSNNPREIEFGTKLLEAWNSQHPAVAVRMQPVPEGQSSEEVILAAVVGKTTPDIYANMWQGNVEMYAQAGALIALDTLEGFTEFIYERCDSATIREITSSDGHIYQVPWKVNPFMTIYNKSLLQEYGITDLPRTYSAYRNAAAVYKSANEKNGLTGRWFGYTEVKAIWYQRLFNFYPLYLAASNGAPLVEHNRAAFNNKYAVEVFRFLQSLYTDRYFSRENLAASSDPFAAGLIVTKWTGPWEISYLKSLPDRNFEFDYYEPIVPDDHEGPVFTYADPKNIVVFNTCSNPQLAWDFIKTLVDKKGDLQLLQVTGQLPRRKNLKEDRYYAAFFKQNPMLITFAKQLPYIKGVDNCDVIVEVLDIISQEYETCVVYGRKTPEEAIEDAARAVNVLLKASEQ